MESKKTEILTQNTRSLLIKFSIPAVVGMIVNALYNLVDTLFVAIFASSNELAGLNIGAPLVMLIFAFGIGVGQGAASLISIAVGKGEDDEIENTAGVMYFMVIIMSVLFGFAGFFFAENIAVIFGAKGEVVNPATEYIQIFMIGSFFIFFSQAGNNTLRAVGQFRLATIAMVLGIITNVILDPIFIAEWGLGLGAAGAAWASVIGYIVTTLFYVCFVFMKVPSIRFRITKVKFNPQRMYDIFFIGLPGLIRNLALSLIMIAFNMALNDDTMYVNIYGVFNKVSYVLLMPSYGIIQGMMPIAGANYGANNGDRVKSVTKESNIAVHLYLIISGLLIGVVLAGPILTGFTGSADEVYAQNFVKEGKIAFAIMMPALALMGLQLVMSSLLQALGSKYVSLFVASLRVILMIPLMYLLSPIDNYIGIWLALPIADLITAIVCGVLYIRLFKKM